MNSSYTHYSNLRLIKDAQTRQVGDRKLVTLTVALNSFGEKAKARFTTKFVEATFSGAAADRAEALTKGSTVSFRGCEEMREYKGKYYFEVQYAEGLQIHAAADAPAEVHEDATDPEW